ncbi:MAG: PKD domain-containing protein [Thermodesulfobacteriota bacterium]
MKFFVKAAGLALVFSVFPGLFPDFCSAAVEKNLHVEWAYDTSLPGLAGYKIYQEGNAQPVHTVPDPAQLSADFSVTFATDTASFTMTAYDAQGIESPHSAPYTVTLPSPLAAAIGADVISGEAPLVVRFNGTGSSGGSGTITSYAWNFGDGGSSTGQTVEHTFSGAGLYTVELTVTDSAAATATARQQITVTSAAASGNLLPVAHLTSSVAAGEAPLAVHFDAGSSVDGDGSIVSYSWNFGDGGTATGVSVDHTYAAAGVYGATVTVTDDEGGTGIAGVVITVTSAGAANTPPIAILETDVNSGPGPLAVSFDAGASSDIDGSIVAYAWNFGDGATATGSFVQHTYDIEGTYTVRLTITDDLGATAETTTLIVVQAAAPVTRTYSGGVTVNGAPLDGMLLKVVDGANSVLATYPVSNGTWTTEPLAEGTYAFWAVYGNQARQVVAGQVVDWQLTFRTLSGTINGLVNNGNVVVIALSNTARLMQGIRLPAVSPASYSFTTLLPASDYIVSAVTLDRPVQYFDKALTADGATPVDLSAADAGGIDFNFTMQAGATLTGAVTVNGAPAAAIPMYAYETDTSALLMTLTDGSGNYRLSLAGGNYILFAARDGRIYYYAAAGVNQNINSADQVRVTDGASLAAMDLAISTCGFSISGTAIDLASNAPVAGALMTAKGASNLASAFTDRQGNFTIDKLCADRYQVFFAPAAGDYPVQERPADLSGGTSQTGLDFFLNSGVTLSGKITDATSGSGLANATVVLRNGTTGQIFGYRYFRTDADGKYLIRDIPGGTYTLSAMQSGYQNGVREGMAVHQDLVQDLALTQGGSIMGSVTDDTGAPIANTLVVAQSAGGEPVFSRTDASGFYRIGGLAPERSYVVMAQRGQSRGYQLHGAAVHPTVAGISVDFVLQTVAQTVAIAGKVTLACDGSAVAGARIVAAFADAGARFFKVTTTDATGAYALADMPAHADYSLAVVPGGDLRSVVYEAIDGSSAAIVTRDVQLACGQSISGAVSLVNVASQAYAVLFDANNKFVDYKILSAKDGNGDYMFSFDNLADGSYRLVISAGGMAPKWYQNGNSFETATPITPGGAALRITFGQ